MSFLAAFIYRQFIHYPPAPSASFVGKTTIVTGSNVGLGLEACRSMVKLGASRVILACRNVERGQAAAKDIRASTTCAPDTLEVWQLDLSSYKSVLAFADRAQTELPRLDVLLLNAGINTRHFCVTEDNEETITTNVISLALLACLLHPKLCATASSSGTPAHLTITASELYEVAKFTERAAPVGQLFATLNNERTAKMGDRYNVSKLLEIFVVKQLAALAPYASSKVIVNCVAPGFVASPTLSAYSFDLSPHASLANLYFSLCNSALHREHDSATTRLILKLIARPSEVGARTLVHGASAGPETHGQYVPDCKVTPTKGLCRGTQGKKLQKRVWEELKEKLEVIRGGVTNLEA